MNDIINELRQPVATSFEPGQVEQVVTEMYKRGFQSADIMEQQQKRIAELEAQLAANNPLLDEAANAIDIYENQLAESQALEAVLREALDAVQQVANRSEGIAGWHLNGDLASWDELLPEVEQALSQPTDDSALKAIVQRAGEVMRERCESMLRYQGGFNLDLVHALPGVTLEDLQK